MGFFSNLFKKKLRPVASTVLGNFYLFDSPEGKNNWSNDEGEILLTVQGTAEAPFSDQLRFLTNLPNEIEKLDDAINSEIKNAFSEADEPINFTHWKDKFKLVAAAINKISAGKTCWIITLEDQEADFYHYNLYVEGSTITDVTVDT